MFINGDMQKFHFLPKLIYKFIEIPTKIPIGFFKGHDRLTLKFIWKIKAKKSQDIPEEE